MHGYHSMDYNPRVLVVLIETGHCQKLLNSVNKSDYPKFLITILRESDRNFVKESVCRMIIKSFGKRKSKDGTETAGATPGMAG
jgi:hypothetical protein